MKMKAFTLGLAAVVGMSMLTGCAPGSAKSLVSQYAKEDHNNYHAAGNISLGMTFDYSGMSVDFPLDITVGAA